MSVTARSLLVVALAACHGAAPATHDGAVDGAIGSDAGPDAAFVRGKCDSPLTTVGDPSAPHGVFAIEFPQKTEKVVPDVVLNNPAVCGGNVYIVWSYVDAGPTAVQQYDFSSIDTQIAEWTGAGRSVNLIIWAMSDGATNYATPTYVTDQITTVSCASSNLVPVFWKEPYPTLYKAFMAEVLARYATNPAIGYIRFGLSQGGETFPVCKTTLNGQGFTTPIWESYIADMVAYQTTQTTAKQLMIGINSYGTPPDDSVPDYEAGLAIANHFGFGSQGLQAADITNYDQGQACAVDWCGNFNTYVGQGPLQLQLVAPSVPDGTGTGSLVDLLPFAVTRHAQILELFESDLEVAYDPANADYAQYGSGYRTAVEAAADVLGGR